MKANTIQILSKSVLLIALTALISFPLGCEYYNIPEQKGDVAKHAPNDKVIKVIVVEALRGVVEDRPFTSAYGVKLLPNTDAIVYTELVPQIGSKAVPVSGDIKENLPTLEVKQVFVRGWRAQVDIIRPVVPSEPGGVQQLVTAYLKYDPVAHWNLDSVRVWRTSVEDALLLSRPGDEPIPTSNSDKSPTAPAPSPDVVAH